MTFLLFSGSVPVFVEEGGLAKKLGTLRLTRRPLEKANRTREREGDREGKRVDIFHELLKIQFQHFHSSLENNNNLQRFHSRTENFTQTDAFTGCGWVLQIVKRTFGERISR